MTPEPLNTYEGRETSIPARDTASSAPVQNKHGRLDLDRLAVLFKRAQANPATQFEPLYLYIRPHILASSYKYLGSLSDAQDCAQDVALSLFRKLDSIKNPRAVLAYVNRATRNRAFDMQQRAEARHVVSSLDSSKDETEVTALLDTREDTQPHISVERGEERSRILAHIAALEPHDSEVLTLRYYYDLTNTEIAATLGVSDTAVSSRLHRACKRLKKELSAAEFALLLMPARQVFESAETGQGGSNANPSSSLTPSTANATGVAKGAAAFLGTAAGKAIAIGTAVVLVFGGVGATLYFNKKSSDIFAVAGDTPEVLATHRSSEATSTAYVSSAVPVQSITPTETPIAAASIATAGNAVRGTAPKNVPEKKAQNDVPPVLIAGKLPTAAEKQLHLVATRYLGGSLANTLYSLSRQTTPVTPALAQATGFTEVLPQKLYKATKGPADFYLALKGGGARFALNTKRGSSYSEIYAAMWQ